MGIMKFSEYLKQINETPSSWAKKTGLPVTTVWRVANDKGTRNATTLKKIIDECEGKVTFEDLYG